MIIHTSPLPGVDIPEVPITEFVLQGAATYPDRPALIDGTSGRIISFAEAVERYPSHPFDVEIKGEGDAAAAVAAELARLIDEYDLTDHIVVVSFDDAVVAEFRELAPDVEVSPGVDALSAWLLGGTPLDPAVRILQVPPFFGSIPVITPAFWDAVAADRLTVWMWPTARSACFKRSARARAVPGPGSPGSTRAAPFLSTIA